MPTSSPKKILLIEDNRQLSDLLSSQLINTSTSVHTAVTGEEGLGLIRSEMPDLIVMDLALPKMRGEEVLRKLYADTPDLKTPVIVLSNTADVSLVDELKKLGPVTFLPKSEQDFHSVLKVIHEKLETI
jgi:CheY-like chemotaxis protein